MMWEVSIARPVKGVLRRHGKKRRATANLGMPHRQAVALHTTCGGIGVVWQLRERHHGSKRAKGNA